MGKAGRGDATNAVGARQIVVHGAAGKAHIARADDIAADAARTTVELQGRA